MSEKVVIDTSVMISALIGRRGASREVIRRCLTGKYQPLISNSLFQEYEDVSSRKQVREICPLRAEEIRDLLSAYYSVCTWVPIYYLWRPNLTDDSDNFLIELALAGNSRTIVTNNVKDLRAAELKFDELRILKPRQLLRGD
ncbi:MAG: putative toxin-antitoxin system toxin component, PIN family [Pseudomonadales bacterium]|nr:putative toxin-antitoxin system toxin component, PIN family [Pseudomonadales bacterium]